MSRTSVPDAAGDLLARLAGELEQMSPQLRKAAAFVLDHPDDVGLASVRELATAAEVKPNTLVRLARAVGCDGFEEFRAPFRAALRGRADPFPDRAQWLQDLAAGGRLGSLYAELAAAALANVAALFAGLGADEAQAIADRIVGSRRTYVIGVGSNYALANNFAYLVGMAVEHVVAVPDEGRVPMDSIVRAGPEDVVVALTFAPYRAEVVDATAAAREQGAAVVAITDTHASPIAAGAAHVILAAGDTPGFFPSTLAAAAALETLASFIVADAPAEVVATIDRFHRRRYDLGVYYREGE